jgi:hypothetical protein
MTLRTQLANRLWYTACRRQYGRYSRALANCRSVQQRLLADTLARNAATDFGRRHDFARLKSPADFRAAVPVTDYEVLLPDFERIADGEPAVLTAEPVTHFALTSGSCGAAKRIPYTASLQRQFRAALAPWIRDSFERQPALRQGAAYWSITPLFGPREQSPGGIPNGFEEDSAYLGRALKPLIDATLAAPGTVARITEMEDFRRATMLCLLGRADLALISVWHPTFLTLLLDWMSTHWESLLQDLSLGFRLEAPELALPPAPGRACALGHADPADTASIWPNLALISCWGDGPAKPYLSALAARFPQARIQNKGLIATEGFLSLPFAGRWPLAVTSHYFEFETAEGEALSAWQLEQGRDYGPLLTTDGGLYRYRLGDRVRCTGHLGDTPTIAFLGKVEGCCDRFGEKLNEAFVADVLQRLFRARGLDCRFALLAPEVTVEGTRYTLFIETPQAATAHLAAELDNLLRTNPHYDYCLRLGQLLGARICKVPPGAQERYMEHLVARKRRLGDIKPTALSTEDDWGNVLCRAGSSRLEERGA